jgi:hypothetical protein
MQSRLSWRRLLSVSERAFSARAQSLHRLRTGANGVDAGTTQFTLNWTPERVFPLPRTVVLHAGFPDPLPSFDQKHRAWARRRCKRRCRGRQHMEGVSFGLVPGNQLSFFRNLPSEGWMRSGNLPGTTVYGSGPWHTIIAGHVAPTTMADIHDRLLDRGTVSGPCTQTEPFP